MTILAQVQRYGFYLLLSPPNEQGLMTARLVDPTDCAIAEHRKPATVQVLVDEARKYIEKVIKENEVNHAVK